MHSWGKLQTVLCRAESLSHVRLCATPWTAARQSPLSMGFSRQEYWSGLPCPPPGESSRPMDRTQVFHIAAAAAAKSCQSCPTLCNPTDGSTSGFPVPGILQARTLEWVAISFSTKKLTCFISQSFVTPERVENPRRSQYRDGEHRQCGGHALSSEPSNN